jgi:ABC-type phosphate/phosphonate transport system substrate-binding protein
MKILKYILIVSLFISCQQKSDKKKITSDLKSDIKEEQINRRSGFLPEPDINERLKNQKSIIDYLKSENKLKLEVFVKEPNKEKLTLVINKKWPEIIENTYQFWKNENDNIVKIIESPFSKNGDWEIEYQHYFDKKGQTFAFERNTSFSNSICAEGIVNEKITEYYNSDFNRTERNYSLIDKNKTELKKENCEINYDFPFEVYNNLKNYQNKINYGS